MADRIFIIAEAGINHNGSLRQAKKLIDAAVCARADAVKFQTFEAAALVSRYAPLANYQKAAVKRAKVQLDMLKKYEMGLAMHQELLSYCLKKKIAFISSPFDLRSIDLLADLGMSVFKIPSGEITNLPYLERIGALRKKIIMSTGMASLKEISAALRVLEASGTKREEITVLHCNSAYPTPMEDANLKAMLTLRDKFKVRVGYSDHTLGIEAAVAATALGATVIEKHLTLGRFMEGPDHQASLLPQEFREMVQAIRNIEKALGSGIKRPSRSEAENLNIARKSIVALSLIKKGEHFTQENLTALRPGAGISPMCWNKVIGRVAKKDFKKGEPIEI